MSSSKQVHDLKENVENWTLASDHQLCALLSNVSAGICSRCEEISQKLQTVSRNAAGLDCEVRDIETALYLAGNQQFIEQAVEDDMESDMFAPRRHKAAERESKDVVVTVNEAVKAGMQYIHNCFNITKIDNVSVSSDVYEPKKVYADLPTLIGTRPKITAAQPKQLVEDPVSSPMPSHHRALFEAEQDDDTAVNNDKKTDEAAVNNDQKTDSVSMSSDGAISQKSHEVVSQISRTASRASSSQPIAPAKPYKPSLNSQRPKGLFDDSDDDNEDWNEDRSTPDIVTSQLQQNTINDQPVQREIIERDVKEITVAPTVPSAADIKNAAARLKTGGDLSKKLLQTKAFVSDEGERLDKTPAETPTSTEDGTPDKLHNVAENVERSDSFATKATTVSNVATNGTDTSKPRSSVPVVTGNQKATYAKPVKSLFDSDSDDDLFKTISKPKMSVAKAVPKMANDSPQTGHKKEPAKKVVTQQKKPSSIMSKSLFDSDSDDDLFTKLAASSKSVVRNQQLVTVAPETTKPVEKTSSRIEEKGSKNSESFVPKSEAVVPKSEARGPKITIPSKEEVSVTEQNVSDIVATVSNGSEVVSQENSKLDIEVDNNKNETPIPPPEEKLLKDEEQSDPLSAGLLQTSTNSSKVEEQSEDMPGKLNNAAFANMLNSKLAMGPPPVGVARQVSQPAEAGSSQPAVVTKTIDPESTVPLFDDKPKTLTSTTKARTRGPARRPPTKRKPTVSTSSHEQDDVGDAKRKLSESFKALNPHDAVGKPTVEPKVEKTVISVKDPLDMGSLADQVASISSSSTKLQSSEAKKVTAPKKKSLFDSDSDDDYFTKTSQTATLPRASLPKNPVLTTSVTQKKSNGSSDVVAADVVVAAAKAKKPPRKGLFDDSDDDDDLFRRKK